MTERITVSAAGADDAPAMPSWMDEEATTYAQAGVDTAEGARAVDAIKGVVHDHVPARGGRRHRRLRRAVLASRRPRTWTTRCW